MCMKKKLSLFFLFILLFATEVNALDLRLKTDTTTFTKTSTTTPLDTTLQKKIVPTPIVTPTKVLEPEKDDEVLVPIKTEEPPEIIEIKKVTPTTIEKAPQETVQKVPVAEPTPILKPETVKETTIPIREKTILSTPTPIKENFNEVLPEILAPSDEGAGSIFNASIQTSHTVQLRVQDTEEGGKPLYSIEPTQWNIERSNEATDTKEIITIPVEKKTLFQVKNKMFVVDDNRYSYEKLVDTEDDFFIGINLKTSSSSKTSHFTIQPQNDCLALYFSEDSEKKIDVCDDLETETDGAYLSSGEAKYKLNTNPDLVFQALKNSVEKEQADFTTGSLSIQDDTAMYQFDVLEKHKLFWFFPVTIQAKLKINAEDNSILPVEYPWYGAFFEDTDYALNFIFAPNLVFESVTTQPQSVHTGDKVTFITTIKNIGTDRASAGFTTEAGPSSVALFFTDDLEVDRKETGFFIEPGESTTISLVWNAVLCNVPVTIQIDPDNIIEEVHEDDNTWTWNVECAPSDAPDLVADPLTYSNNYKRIGAQNTVHFTFRNTGTQPSPEHTSIFEYDNLSSSIVVPPLDPDKSWSTTRTVTPRNCDSVKLDIDAGNTVVEFQEENNTAFEHPSIIDSCNRRADLFVDSVWWKAGGYTAGEIHAGEELWFEYKVKNDPVTWSNHDACLSGFKVSLKLNGAVIKSENLGWIGCVDDYSYNHPDYWKRTGHFTYTPQCNGEKLTIEVDPSNTVSEGKENNNTWSFDVVCTLPPPTLGN